MKCQTTELEIETLVSRIKNGDMELQPYFQRGEVWPTQKKKKLIDSILRGWRIPPIHVVLNSQAIDEILDGQQRLAAIRDFQNNKLRVDGFIEPYDENIAKFHGMLYKDLPPDCRRRFNQYSINVVRLTEYAPEEPAELFYRLNQPSALTSAEQRNAYMGETRDQVKNLALLFSELGADKELLGFSNSRLAYDEVISKFCFAIDLGTLKKKIIPADISEKYRKGEPFSQECINIADNSIRCFLGCLKNDECLSYSFNKATLFSWLIFVSQNLTLDKNQLQRVILFFEFCRSFIKGKLQATPEKCFDVYMHLSTEIPCLDQLFYTFNQRASIGSTDAISVIHRDIIINIIKDALIYKDSDLLKDAKNFIKKDANINFALDVIAEKYSWGELMK